MIGQLIGQYAIGESQQFSDALSGSYYFNGFNLSDCGNVALQDSTYDDITASVETYRSPQNDGGGVLSWFVHDKPITFNIAIKEDTEEDLNAKIDLLKRKLAKGEGVLKIKVNGDFRTCRASLVSIRFNRDFEIKEALSNVTVSFLAMESIVSETPVSVSEIGVSSATVAFDVENEGGRCNYKMYIIFGTVSGTDSITITQGDYTLDISETITTGSILIIDGITGNVTLNGTEIDYSGPMMMLEEGSNAIQVGINGTYIADITIIYNTNYW